MASRLRRRPSLRSSLALCASLFCCASSPSDQPPPPTPPDTAEIQALPGYRSARVASRIFPRSETYVVEVGPESGPAVILIHGISPDGAHDWDEVVPVLAKSRRVLMLDLPGFGRSGKEPAHYSPVTYATLIDELIEARVSGEFDVVAHSMGVSIGLELASRHPDRIRRLLIADAAAILHGQSVSLEQIEKGTKRLGAFGELLGGIQRGAYDMMGRVPDKLVHRFAISIPGEAAGTAAARLMAHDSGAALDAIAAPTLIVWGRHDDVASERGAWALVSRLADARLAFIEDAGHTPMRETPEEFNRIATRWLDGYGDVGAAPMPARVPSNRNGECRKVRGRIEFTGAYQKILIEGCRNVVLEGVRAEEIEITSSTVVARDVVVSGGEVGMLLYRARVKLSGGEIRGQVPLRLRGSELDFAGVTFVGEHAAIEAFGNAKLLCSLCRLESQGAAQRLHGFRVMRAADKL